MGKMHADEIETDAGLVRELLADQFPQWTDLPIRRIPSGGTVNALYRLGDDLAVRLPLLESDGADIEREFRWLPQLAPHLPVSIPAPVAKGLPAAGYPSTWAIHRWLEGSNPVEGDVPDPEALAGDLAEFVIAMRRIDLPGGPPAYRGGPLTTQDPPTRRAIEQLEGIIDTAAATTAWEASLHAPAWTAEPVWLHADLMPGNLLVRNGRLSAVIDFATAGVGDPACDLIVAWNLLPAAGRTRFRAALDVDDATWIRGRGRSLSMALNQLPYYQDTNPAMAANARYVIAAVLADVAARGSA
ncbi:MAG TPA: aminoglycoside phosphotransferase family protein [Mycobacteriales bacterium]|nr:aminoglycoside phosphotransferase family protein [Mycobacteriales bacterium]